MKRYALLLKPTLNSVTHVLFWVVIYFFFTYFLGFGSSNVLYVSQFSFFLMPITIIVSYFFLFFLIPKYLLEKKHGLFILYTVYTFIISSFLIVLSVLYGSVFLLNSNEIENASPVTKSLPLIILGVYLVVLIVVLLGLVKQSYQSTIKNEELKSKFLETQLQLKEQELKFLKMQIHPHFLFNTLNTLYGFTLKKSDDAPDMILKLSNLLDYILYQVDKPLVLLSDEIKHIEDYIALEKMRFQDSLEVFFEKETHQENIEIAPMLLLPFVENAFKHGIQIDGVLKVIINLKTTKDSLTFEISNSTKNNLENKKGIGLENIKKRLEMLYETTFRLNISQTESTFKVKLKTPFKNV